MNFSCPECSKCPATRDQSLLWNDRIALSMNSCDKSFHIDSRAVFSSTMLTVLPCISDSVPASRPTHDKPIDWDMCIRLNRVIFMSQSLFSLIMPICSLWKINVQVQIVIIFWMQQNVAMKFAWYMAWIALSKHCKFDDNNYYNSMQRYRIFPRGLLLARPVPRESWISAFPPNNCHLGQLPHGHVVAFDKI